MSPQRRIDALLLSGRSHALQRLHILVLDTYDLQIIFDPLRRDRFRKHDAAAADLVGNQEGCGRD